VLSDKINEQRELRGKPRFDLTTPEIGCDVDLEQLVHDEADRLAFDYRSLAAVFVRHSVTEQIGSATIQTILKDCLLEHAADEKKHSRIFANIAKRLAPDMIPEESFVRAEAKANEVFLREFRGNVAQFICDTHVAEVRNLVYLGNYIAEFSDVRLYRELGIVQALEVILADEVRHVGYTGRLIDAWASDGVSVTDYLSAACKQYSADLRLQLKAAA
jgi:hypothetical protein